MKKLVITEGQLKRLFENKERLNENSWMNMDDEEKREYLQQYTSDADKIEQLIRSSEDPTGQFDGEDDMGNTADISVERPTDHILDDMSKDVEELQRSINIIKSRM